MATATATPARRLASIPTGADYLGVHPMTLRRYIASGRITAYRVGPRLLKVSLDELDAFIHPIVTTDGPS